jgi:hypothetical protein
MKSPLHCLIPFLPLFSNCQHRRLDSVQFLCSQAHILAGWRLETRLDSSTVQLNSYLLSLHGPHGKHRLLLSRIVLGLFTAPLHSNGRGSDYIENSFSIVDACLPRARVYRVVA